jgi:hypothetical protein
MTLRKRRATFGQTDRAAESTTRCISISGKLNGEVFRAAKRNHAFVLGVGA